MNVIERLETIKRLNSNVNWVNEDLYRLVCSPQMAVLAYQRIKSKPGNMTPGSDGTTLDGVSMQKLERLSGTLREQSYRPAAVRRVHIPKTDGSIRPLGIPTPRDKIVQEMVRALLASIFDPPSSPTFLDSSHGFRERRSCHTAVDEFTRWNGVTWLIEGDIEKFFDSVDHQILMRLLRRRIKDERFLNLLWKFLRGGVQEENGRLWVPKVGVPQGGNLSPILANIYLHEFDLWADRLRAELTRGAKRKPNPQWRSLVRRRDCLAKKPRTEMLSAEMAKLDRQARELPTVMVDDPDFCRVYYVRYADDWLIGITGPKSLATDVKKRATEFLGNELRLTLSEGKTKVTHAKTKSAKFLGFRLRTDASQKRRMVRTEGKRTTLKRVTGWLPRIGVPVQKVMESLRKAGFCASKNGNPFFPCSRKSFVALEDHEIILRFNSVWRGIYNYFCLCNDAVRLRRVMYILQYSCLMTLSHKHRSAVPKVIRKYGVFPSARFTVGKGERKTIKFWRPSQWQSPPPPSSHQLDLAVLTARTTRLTRHHLFSPCAVCANDKDVEMHHIRALHRQKARTNVGFSRIMGAINRKQVPLCVGCHNKVHAGQYDSLALTDLAYVPQ